MGFFSRELEDERGNAILEFIAGGLLFLIPMIYIMLAIFDVQRGWYGISSAAREATRVHTLSDADGAGQAAAKQAIKDAMSDQGLETGYTLEGGRVQCEGGCLQSGSVSVATITYQVPLPLWPEALGARPPAITLTTTHRTPYGLFRQDR